MAWIRLYVTVEGQCERKFADAVLKPHLEQFEIEVRTRVVITNRKLGKRGGILDYAKLQGDLVRLMKEDRNPEARFSTMVDLYALPREFPGWTEAERHQDPIMRVTVLEDALRNDIDDTRFLPYIQLHEFEALLYCDLTQLSNRITGSEKGIARLANEVVGKKPEEINEGEYTAPSKRIIKHVPIYEKSKTRVGAPAAEAIGLEDLRNKCPHFSEWVNRMESLQA